MKLAPLYHNSILSGRYVVKKATEIVSEIFLT